MRIALLVCAPDVPESEMKALRKQLRKALGKKAKFAAVNYNVNVTTLACK
jgi:hypothetical protein